MMVKKMTFSMGDEKVGLTGPRQAEKRGFLKVAWMVEE
jgi:hypothetical protein